VRFAAGIGTGDVVALDQIASDSAGDHDIEQHPDHREAPSPPKGEHNALSAQQQFPSQRGNRNLPVGEGDDSQNERPVSEAFANPREVQLSAEDIQAKTTAPNKIFSAVPALRRLNSS